MSADAQSERERSIIEDQVKRLTRALAKTHDALTAKDQEVQRVQAELVVSSRQLQKERAARDQVVADLKALVAFEAKSKLHIQDELQKERAESQAQRSALRQQLRLLQNQWEQARQELPAEWDSVKKWRWEASVCEQGLDRARRALRASQTLGEVLLEQLGVLGEAVSRLQTDIQAANSLHSVNARAHREENGNAAVRIESLQHQLASAQEAWQDAEKERIEAEQRCGEAVQRLKRIPEEKETIDNLHLSLKEALEDSFMFEALYQRAKQQLVSLEEEKTRVRDKTMQLYFDRDYVHAKPLVELLLDMNPADEEALCCYKVILQSDIKQMEHQRSILHRTSHYTVQVLDQAHRLAPRHQEALQAAVEEQQEQAQALTNDAAGAVTPQVLDRAWQGYERALKLLSLASAGPENTEIVDALVIAPAPAPSGSRKRFEGMSVLQRAELDAQEQAHERRMQAIARLTPNDAKHMLARDSELAFRRPPPPTAAAVTEEWQGDHGDGGAARMARPPARLVYAHVAGIETHEQMQIPSDGQPPPTHVRVPEPSPKQQHAPPQPVSGAEAWMPAEAERLVFEHRFHNARGKLEINDAESIDLGLRKSVGGEGGGSESSLSRSGGEGEWGDHGGKVSRRYPASQFKQIYADLVTEVSKAKTISELQADKVSFKVSENRGLAWDDTLVCEQGDGEGEHLVGPSGRDHRRVRLAEKTRIDKHDVDQEPMHARVRDSSSRGQALEWTQHTARTRSDTPGEKQGEQLLADEQLEQLSNRSQNPRQGQETDFHICGEARKEDGGRGVNKTMVVGKLQVEGVRGKTNACILAEEVAIREVTGSAIIKLYVRALFGCGEEFVAYVARAHTASVSLLSYVDYLTLSRPYTPSLPLPPILPLSLLLLPASLPSPLPLNWFPSSSSSLSPPPFPP
jgi:hypothetical protein